MTAMSAVKHDEVIYPESDGQPMAENETQGAQIVRLVNQLELHFRGSDDVHVGFDLLWYPVEGHPEVCRAPDVFVVPGRPQFPLRGSWKQWEEDGTPMRHVVEVLSPSNTPAEMIEKRRWYDRYGAEEYVVFDPETGSLDIHVRTDLGLVPISDELVWVSEVLEGCQYLVDPGVLGVGPDTFDLVLCDPAGHKVDTPEVLAAKAARAENLEAQLRAAGIEPEV